MRRFSAPAGNCTQYDSRRGLLCSYGSVYVGRQRDGSGALFAVKALPLADGDEATSVATEVAQLQQCANANVVRYHSSTCVNAHLWILMELCACSIRDVMNAKGAALEEEQIAVVCRESLQGLAYLHSLAKVHRDIKCSNILLTERGEVKLSDFGVTVQVRRSACSPARVSLRLDPQLTATQSKRNTFVGTPHWMAVRAPAWHRASSACAWASSPMRPFEKCLSPSCLIPSSAGDHPGEPLRW